MDLFKILGIVAIETDEASGALDNVSGKAESSEGRITSAFKKIGKAVATYFAVDKIIDFGKECVNVAAEVSAQASAFAQIMVDNSGASYVEEATAKMTALADEVGMVDTRLTPYMTSLTAKFKGLGYDVEDATDLATRGLTIAADASAFWDKSLDESMSHLNSFINGSYEGGEAIGLFANDTQMAAYAVESGLIKATKEWANLDEATKQATRLEYAENMFELSGATGQAAKEADQYANIQANLAEKWRQFKAQIGEPILQNIVIPAMEKLSGVVDYLSSVVFPALQSVAGDLGEFWREILEPAIIAVGEAFGEMFSPLSELIPKVDIGRTALDAIREACYLLEDALLWLASNVPPIFSTAMEAISDTWDAIGKPVFDIIQTYVKNVADVFGKKMPAIKEFVSNCFSDIKVFWENNLLPCFTAIGDFIEGYLAPIFDAVFTVAIGGVVNNVFNTIKSLWENTLKPVFTGITTFLTGVFTGNWGQAFRGILDIATGIWNGIETAINSVMESIKTIVATGITFLREAFNFDWSLPKIKLPHFRIDGTFSLNPPSVPSFGIDWYAKGGVLEEPTIFGMNGNRLMGGGEAGAEAVAPIDVLQGYVAEAVASQNAGLVTVLERILDAILAMDANMGGNLREALDGTSFSINHREFGRLVKAVN